MEDAGKILANMAENELLLTKEVQKLREENASLKKENKLLQSRVTFLEARLKEAESSEVDDDDLLLSDAFDSFYFKGGRYDRAKNRTYNCFNRAGYKTIRQFEGKSIIDLLDVRNAGAFACAVVIIVLEHFGVQIAIPDTNDLSVNEIGWKPSVRDKSTCKEMIKRVLTELPKIREVCVFMK